MMNEMGDNNPLGDEDFREIENEVMIAVGDKDKMVTLEETIHIYRQLKKAQLTVLPNTIHPVENISLSKLAVSLREFFNLVPA